MWAREARYFTYSTEQSRRSAVGRRERGAQGLVAFLLPYGAVQSRPRPPGPAGRQLGRPLPTCCSTERRRSTHSLVPVPITVPMAIG